MNIFIESHISILRELLNADVEFIVIGGYSVIYHGYERTTGDIDIWLRPDNSNKTKLLPVLEKFDLDKDESDVIALMDFTEPVVITLWDVPEKVDFLTQINLVEYNEADTQKVYFDWEGMSIPFLHLNHLILSKINTGRPKDAADIDELQKVARQKNNK